MTADKVGEKGAELRHLLCRMKSSPPAFGDLEEREEEDIEDTDPTDEVNSWKKKICCVVL